MIDPTAIIDIEARIDSSVKIGARTRVWQFASIIRDAVIGPDCMIAACAAVDGAVIGTGCRIQSGAVVNPGVWVKGRVFIGQNTVFCNDFWPSVDDNGFDISQFFAGNKNTIIVGREANIGAGVVVLPGIVIGERAMIGAGAVVDQSVPDDCLFKRDGTIEPIHGQPKRMRFC